MNHSSDSCKRASIFRDGLLLRGYLLLKKKIRKPETIRKRDPPMSSTPRSNSEATAHQTMSLDGSWQVIFDHDNKGRTLNWQDQEQFDSCHESEEVAVPACLEEFRQDYEGVAWYGKSFRLPEDWEGKTIRVQFEAVNYRAEVWVNGEAAGAHEGGYTGFELEDR